MTMTPRRRRMVLVGLILLGVSAAAAFALTAFQDNLLYYYPPSDIAAGKAPMDRVFRLGGMVEEGSLKRETGSMEVRFIVTDFQKDVTVSYSGVLPDLFREGQGVIARGKPGPEALVGTATAGGLRHGLNDYTGWFADDADMKGDYFGYDGPCPPWNDTIPHRYVFTVYALDIDRVPVEGKFTGADVRRAIEGHVLAQASYTGTYALNPKLVK